ncbi:hypothetical protein ETB97_002187 [Aspergillus alliaceus]|uniref:Kinesin light chain n=1 Tax=Petromyces alliaceus TaxID=209559 RepID=A0A8H5ZZM1_PETAA|nr:hypothetical protein ETB97_002187 [Aspergillus burnettii]
MNSTLQCSTQDGPAISIFELLCQNRSKLMSGPNHVSTIDSIIELGNWYADRGKLAEAEVLYQHALQGYRGALGQYAVSPLETLDSLGIIYSAANKPDEARRMLFSALESKLKVFGPEHRSTLMTAHNIGKLYADQGENR